MTDVGPAQDDAAESFLASALELPGAIAGAGVGLAVGGPGGALAGAAVGPLATGVIKQVARDLRRRFLSPKEEQRIGTALAYALEEIRRHTDAGERVRFDAESPEDHQASAAAETLEGVLLAAQRSYEAKKVPYIGRLFAGILFDASFGIDVATASLLIRLSEELSYRQLVLSALVGRNRPRDGEANPLALRDEVFWVGRSVASGPIAHEIFELATEGLLEYGDPREEGSGERVPVGPKDHALAPAFLRLSYVARMLHDTAELWRIPDAELLDVGQFFGLTAQRLGSLPPSPHDPRP